MRKCITMFFCVVLAITQLAAQNRTVKGKITDDKGNGIAQASILVKGTAIGTTSDNDGSYILSIPSTAKTLVVFHHSDRLIINIKGSDTSYQVLRYK